MSQVKEAPELTNRLVTLREPVVVTAPRTAPERRQPPPVVLVVALVLMGIGLRAVPMFGDRNLWIDEAMLALNIVERSASGLTQPLDWNQGAPVGFLMATKAAAEALGPSAFALRVVAFLASALGVIAFGWLVTRLLPSAAATFALVLYAISPHAISYAAECKQYASDAALAIGLFAVSLRLLQGEGGRRRWVALALAGAGAVWFSHPSVFVLGGIGSALLFHALIAKDRTRFLAATATVGTWLISFAVCYVLFLKQLGQSKYLVDYWNGHFLPLNPSLMVTWLLDHYFAVFAYPGGLGGTEIRAGGIAAALFAVGVWGFGKERWPLALALVLPAVLAVGASGVQKYPFSGRLLLFLVPLLVIGVARGAWMVGAALRPTVPFAAFALLGVLTAAPALETIQEFRRPLRYEQITPVIEAVRGEWQPGDRMYVYYGAIPAFTFYTRGNPFPADAVTLGTEARDDRLIYRDEIAAFKGRSRVWVVFSHRHKDEESLVRAYAESHGKCLRVVKQPGAAAYLFDFSGTTVAR